MTALALAALPDWPAALTRDAALAFSGVSEAQMRQWARTGKVRFRPRGPNGAMLALKSDIETALIDLFTVAEEEDWDFGE